jgi:signal transduction histidine kinase
VEERAGELEVTIRDDGCGGAEVGAGSGLQGLRDRVSAMNGTLEIESRPGTGTTVCARLPAR